MEVVKVGTGRLLEWLSARLSSNITTSSTALQTFLHYVTLMNDAVMSQCQSLVKQLSSECVC